MGLFKRSKNSKNDDDQAADSDSGPDSKLKGMPGDQPRCRHYVFAHVALRQVAFEYPVEIVAALGSEKADALIDDLWQSVEQACNDQGTDDRASVDRQAIRVHRVRVGVYPTAIVEMPTPIATTEAYFAAVVLCVDPEATGLSKEDIDVRFFTLEFGAKLAVGDQDRTVLCEWTADGLHANMGDGPIADVALFANAIKAVV